MADVATPRAIEVDTDSTFQEKEWKAQRIAWAVGVIALVVIGLGITGSGPLSRASAEGDDGATSVDYSRFAHRGAPTTVRITLQPAGQSELQVWIDEAVMQDYRLESITPQPDSTVLDGDRVVHAFQVKPSSDEVEIFVTLTPARPGWMSFNMGRVDGSTLTISQLIYP